MIKASHLIDFSELDYLVTLDLLKIYEKILYANNQGQYSVIVGFESNKIAQEVKGVLVLDGFALHEQNELTYKICWYE